MAPSGAGDPNQVHCQEAEHEQQKLRRLMAEETEEGGGKQKKEPKCSGFMCSCPECGGRKRKEAEAKKAGKW